MTAPPSVVVEGGARIGGETLFAPLRLELAAGEWTCLLGPSGVGKSSILRLIAGLDTGIAFAGSLRASDGATLAGRTAYMAQSDLLYPWLDVTGNVLLGARLRHQPPDRARAEALIARVGLAAHAGKRPSELSGGQRQRAALARTLMEDRPLILLDEPFSALDARTRAEMQDLAAELLAGRTVLLVTHDPAEAARLGHRILVLDETGLRQMPPPGTPPVRAVDAPETLAAQTALFAALQGGAPA
jgi:putative hydroxymethylpyrimidine transport system ATP-binding protein